MARILITGANGLLGHELVGQLSPQHSIYALVRSKPETPLHGIEYIVSDLSDTFDTQDLPKEIDTIYHLAQSSKFREFPDEAMDIFNVNIRATALLLDYAHKHNIKRFIYASSGGVYGSGDQAFAENAPINARQDLGYYLGSKLCGEILCQNYTQHMAVSIVRFFFLYGPRQKRGMLLPRLVDSVKEGKAVFLQGKEGISINPIHVTDAAKCLEALLPVMESQTLNIAGQATYSLKAICDLIGQATGKEPVYEYIDQPAKDLIADTSLMEKTLVCPDIPLEDGLKDLL